MAGPNRNNLKPDEPLKLATRADPLRPFGKGPKGEELPNAARKTKPLLERKPSPIVNLTEKVTVARAEKQRRLNAGLATDKTAMAEATAKARITAEQERRRAAASTALSKSLESEIGAPKFKRLPTPLFSRPNTEQATKDLTWDDVRKRMASERKSQGSFTDRLLEPPDIPGARESLGAIKDAGKSLLTQAQLGAGLGGQRTTLKPGETRRKFPGILIGADPDYVDFAQKEAQDTFSGLRSKPGAVPHVSLDPKWFSETAYADITKKGGANKVYLDDVIKQYGNGALGVDLRSQLIQMAKDNGWNTSEANLWTDADAAAKAFNKENKSLGGFLQNAAADIGVLASSTNILPMASSALTRSVEQRSLTPTAKLGASFLESWKDHLAVVGKHPIGEMLYSEPFTTLTSNVPVGKFIGTRVGKAGTRFGNPLLSPTRDVHIPNAGAIDEATGRPGGVTVNVPASQNALTRPITKLTDAALARAEHPEARDARNREGGGSIVRDVVGSLGHAIEKRHVKGSAELARRQSGLEVGTAPARAVRRLLDAINGLPTERGDLNPISVVTGSRKGKDKIKQSKKQTRVESLVYHGLIGVKHSDEAVAYYSRGAEQSRRAAEEERTNATQLHESAAESRRSGDQDTATELEADARESEGRAREWDTQAREQELAARYSQENPYDAATLTPQELEVIDAAKHVSRESTRLKVEGGKLGEAGALYGDLQHNLELMNELHPESRGGVMAKVILGHRREMLKLEEVLGADRVAERNSPAARTELGKVRALAPLVKDIQARIERATRKRAEGQERITRTAESRRPTDPAAVRAFEEEQYRGQYPHGHKVDDIVNGPEGKARVIKVNKTNIHLKYEKGGRPVIIKGSALKAIEPGERVPAAEPYAPKPALQGVVGANRERVGAAAEAVAQAAGTEPGVVRSITQAATRRVEELRAGGARELAAEERIASEMERTQREAHDKIAGERVKRAHSALNRAESAAQRLVRGPKPERLMAMRNELEAALDFQKHGYEPNDRLVRQQAKVEKLRTEHADFDLPVAEMNQIIDRYTKPAQARNVNRVVLADAINEALHEGRVGELQRQLDRILPAHDSAAFKYERVSGSSADAAAAYEEHRGTFIEGMKQFRTHQQTEGRDPYHIILHKPGDTKSNQPVLPTEMGSPQFASGNYTRDVHVYMVRDLEATARKAVEDRLFKLVSEGPYVITSPPRGSRVPAGFVLVSEENLRKLTKTYKSAEENTDLIDQWQRDRMAAPEYVPDTGGHVMISKDLHDWISEAIANPKNVVGLDAALKFTNMYRRWMLFTLPRTLVNNAVGNPILAMMGGAGIVDYMRAWTMLKQHPELIPTILRHRGPIANALETMKLTGYQAFFRNKNVFHEDLGRLTVYMHHVVRYAKHEQGLKFYQRVDMASEKMTNLLTDLAEGKDAKVHDFIKFTDQWFGDMAKRGKWDPVLSTGFLFHRWVSHMIHLTMWTMPTKYPGRAAFLLNLSYMADEYRKEHGVWPDWAKPIVGLWHTTDVIDGQPQTVTWGLGTSGSNPFSTQGQTFDLGSYASPKSPLLAAAAANLNPALRLTIEQTIGRRLDTLQEFKDEKGNKTGPFDRRVLLNSLVANTPLVNTVGVRAGLADTAFQFDPNAARRYSLYGIKDPRYYPPSPMGNGFIYDMLVRLGGAFGAPIRPVDTGQGPRTTAGAVANLQVQLKDYKSRLKREALAAEAGSANQR